MRIVVVGLGYVGLPLAVGLAHDNKVFGFDVSDIKISSYRNGIDPSGEVEGGKLKQVSGNLWFSSNLDELPEGRDEYRCFIITVPTPVTEAKTPNLEPLMAASAMVGMVLRPGDTVVYESTVFPGATEDVCVPILEEKSGLNWGEEFFVGYSPERINPGDKSRGLADVVKVISGDNQRTVDLLKMIYGPIIKAGLHVAPSIKVAETAKVLENTQRDLNIGLMNELSEICSRVGINTFDVLEAAGTKWNFLNFQPGLVGGHCIGVDPYYLAHKSRELGHHSEIIDASRRVNDAMPERAAQRLYKKLSSCVSRGSGTKGRFRILSVGLTFKENVADTRNSKSFEFNRSLVSYGCEVSSLDPFAPQADFRAFSQLDGKPEFDAIVLQVYHDKLAPEFIDFIEKKLVAGGVLFDMKGKFKNQFSVNPQFKYISL